MKFANIFLAISLILIVGCSAVVQNNDAINLQPIIFKTNEMENFNGFCVMTSTSNFEGKIRYEEADDEFLMLDELFSKQIPCNTNDDCYEFLLDQDAYRSMAPEFEPYLHCETRSIDEINFKN